MKAVGLAVALTCLGLGTRAQEPPSPIGLWLTENQGGVIQIDRCDNALCGKIAGIVFDHPSDAMPLDYRGQPQCGLTIVDHAASDGEGVWRGRITDPRNGTVYGAQLRLAGRPMSPIPAAGEPASRRVPRPAMRVERGPAAARPSAACHARPGGVD